MATATGGRHSQPDGTRGVGAAGLALVRVRVRVRVRVPPRTDKTRLVRRHAVGTRVTAR